jgi:hypothetical protein
MKKISIKKLLIVLAALFVFATLNATSGEGLYKIKVNSDSKIWIEGDSTMHAYKSVSSITSMNAAALFKVKPDDSLVSVMTDKKYAQSMRDLILNLVVKLNVKNFRSNTPGFDSKFYDTLKAENYPEIVFKPAKYTIQKSGNDNGVFSILSEGTVRIANKEKYITVRTSAKIQNGTVILSGEKDLLMTDFGLTPPELLFVKADDKVTVKWNLHLSLIPGN